MITSSLGKNSFTLNMLAYQLRYSITYTYLNGITNSFTVSAHGIPS